MDEQYLQIAEHTGAGYLPVVRFGAWRVAVLNPDARFERENITQLERHLLTDETFTLLCGNATLYISDGTQNSADTIHAFPLEPCKVYNVRRGVWHAIEAAPGASVLITENDDTSPGNTEKIPITPGMLPRTDGGAEPWGQRTESI